MNPVKDKDAPPKAPESEAEGLSKSQAPADPWAGWLQSLDGLAGRRPTWAQVLALWDENEKQNEKPGSPPVWWEPFRRLTQVFGLHYAEQSILMLCAAAAADPLRPEKFGRHVGVAGIGPGPYLASRLFELGPQWRLGPDSPLLTWELVRSSPGSDPLLGPYFLDPAVFQWLSGNTALPPELLGLVRLRGAAFESSAWPVAEWTARCRKWLDQPSGKPVRVAVLGGRGQGRRSFAAKVVQGLGLKLLEVIAPPFRLSGQHFKLIQRQAFWLGAAPLWMGAMGVTGGSGGSESKVGGATAGSEAWASPDTFPLQFLLSQPGQDLSPDAWDQRLVLPHPLPAEREAALENWIPAFRSWPREKRDRLLQRHRQHLGEWRQAASLGPADAEELESLLRQKTEGELVTGAQRLESCYGWEDLVLTPALLAGLREFTEEAGARHLFWEHAAARRLYPQGRGLSALLAGPPGTGKTMSAMVIANELGLDLWRVDLAAVVSKWVGETSKNLEQVLTRAAQLDVVLFFDEADALFGKRTEIKDAQDRFANSDTNYLLQAVEQYPGILLLATNKKQNLDPAFQRRLRYMFHFQPPTAAQREILFRRVLDELTEGGVVTLGPIQVKTMAESLDLTGAQIKNAILGAAMLAQARQAPLDQALLLRGAERELEKAGQPLDERQRLKLLRSAVDSKPALTEERA